MRSPIVALCGLIVAVGCGGEAGLTIPNDTASHFELASVDGQAVPVTLQSNPADTACAWEQEATRASTYSINGGDLAFTLNDGWYINVFLVRTCQSAARTSAVNLASLSTGGQRTRTGDAFTLTSIAGGPILQARIEGTYLVIRTPLPPRTDTMVFRFRKVDPVGST